MQTLRAVSRLLRQKLGQLPYLLVVLAMLVPAGGLARAADLAQTTARTAAAEGEVFVVNVAYDGDDESCDPVEYEGDCTLREALHAANSNPGLDTIEFDIVDYYEGTGPWTIYPFEPLPAITDPVIVDGYSQPGASPNTLAVGSDAVLQIALNGGECSLYSGEYYWEGGYGVDPCPALTIAASGGGSTIRGLSITGPFHDAIVVEGGGGSTIAGNWIGLRPDGAPDGVGASGIYLNNTADNTVGGTSPADRNVISANRDGIFFAAGAGDTTGNTVLGNYLGTDAAGVNALGNSDHGVFMSLFGPYSLSGNTIGGDSPAARNVISGNGLFNVRVQQGTDNVIAGNYLGTNAAGTAAIFFPEGGEGGEGERNWLDEGAAAGAGGGIQIVGGSGNVISGSADARQVISGHPDRAVFFTAGTADNQLVGNYIGTDADGLDAIPNSRETVHLDAASGTLIQDNLISGNAGVGIRLTGEGVYGNSIVGNWIGVDATGLAALPNASGIVLDTGANGNTIGGADEGDRNVISGNNGTGFQEGRGIDIALAPDNQVFGNYIGLNAPGTAALGNRFEGILVRDGSTGIQIGDFELRAVRWANVISGNGGAGIAIQSSDTTAVDVRGNVIGLNAAGTAPLGNAGAGVLIQAADENTVAGNRIAYNGGAGVRVLSLDLGEGFDDAVRNRIAGIPAVVGPNLIFANDELGIDLGGDGPSPNDAGDLDDGPNFGQNAPVLTAAAPFNDGETSGTFVAGRLNSTPETTFRLEFFTNTVCDPAGFGEGAEFLGDLEVTTDSAGNVDFTGTLPVVAPGVFVTATATDLDGNTSEFSQCGRAGPNNTTWTTAYSLDGLFWAVPGGAVSASFNQLLDQEGQARWYKFSIQPGSVMTISLGDLSSVYDFTVYKDIGQAYEELTASPTTEETLTQLGAEFAPDIYSPDIYSPDIYSPDIYSPDIYSPDIYSPDIYSPDIYSPDPTAYSAAQTRSLVAVSVYNGASRHGISINSWNNTGEYYVRVRGRNGSFSLTDQFELEVQVLDQICQGVTAPSVPTSLAGVAGDFETLILVDYSRLAGTPAEVSALQTALALLKARPEVRGEIVQVNTDARVAAANAVADGAAACPYAKNLVAEAIKQVADNYRELNPNLKYIVLVGGDRAIPFFRYPDRAGLAPESNYYPPVDKTSASEASLRLNYVLGQDEYGASLSLSVRDDHLPIADLAVGRLVETAAEATGLVNAYLNNTTGGLVGAPDTALVTGYDFLAKTAVAVEAELEAGLGQPIQTLITAGGVPPTDPASWTADQLRAALLNSGRHDLVFLAGHFSGNSALAADYATRVLASEVAASSTDFVNAIIFSAGCHSGYNIVDPDSTSATLQPDWAQAFARKQATLIAGTGYQYGDTDFIYYSERLYLNFSQELRRGTGPVSVGEALVRAKQAYLTSTGPTRGIHEKAYLITALFGLPMLSVDMPGDRLSGGGEPSIVGGTTPAGAGTPGAALGLETADVTITPDLTLVTKTVTTPSGSAIASYFVSPDGAVVNPAEPALPLDLNNVTVDGMVLRGVGLWQGSYTDLPGRRPLVSEAVFDLTDTRPEFASDVHYPIRPWRVSYFDALANAGGATQLMFTPAQFISSGLGSPVGTLRRWDSATVRLFYSDHVAASPNGANQPALSAPPALARVDSTVSGGQIHFAVRVTVDPSAGAQAVWVNYTALSGPWHGQWLPLALTQDPGDTTLWTGALTLGATPAANVRFLVQAASGVGLVTLSTNSGAYYIPDVDSNALPQPGPNDPPPAATGLALDPAGSPGEYGDTVSFAATLTSAGAPVSGKTVAFTFGTLTRQATTDGAGRASVTLVLAQQPGAYTLTASFAGDQSFAESGAAAPYTIVKRGTTLTLAPAAATAVTGADTGLKATLLDSAGQPLLQKTVVFVVAGAGGTQTVTGFTNNAGQAALGAVTLPAGSYAVTAYFGTVISPTLDLTDDLYAGSTATATLTLSGGFPGAGVLDNFNRANGGLGQNWVGTTGGYAIRSQRLKVLAGGPILWRGPNSVYGVNQEAFVTLVNVDTNGREQDLLLKVQGGSAPDWGKGAIEVLYDARAGAVRVETFRLRSPAWTIYANIPVVFNNGDQLGARALATGQVEIYKNGVLIGTVTLNAADQAFFNNRGGRIGLWFIDARNSVLDDFGGGTLTP